MKAIVFNGRNKLRLLSSDQMRLTPLRFCFANGFVSFLNLTSVLCGDSACAEHIALRKNDLWG